MKIFKIKITKIITVIIITTIFQINNIVFTLAADEKNINKFGSDISNVTTGSMVIINDNENGMNKVNSITTDKVNFTDSNFEQVIRNSIPKPIGDITEGDMESIIALNFKGTNISNLNGIQYAKNLQSIIITGGSNIDDISYLTNLKKLKQIKIGDSDISDISYLSNLTDLMELDMHNNNISNISPLSGLNNLDNIDLDSNNISDILPLQKKFKLTSLSLNNNNIQDITELGTNINMQTLQLSGNNISDITAISSLTKLEYLGLGENSIHDISPLSWNIELKYLYLSDNDIDDISPLSGLTNLLRLYLSDNNDISDITPLKNIINLQYLYLANNKINDVTTLSSMKQLKEINLYKNEITDISPLVGIVNSDLNFVNLEYNRIPDILALTGIANTAKVYFDGYVTKKYINENGDLIEPATEDHDVAIGNYTFDATSTKTYKAKKIEGYELNDIKTKTIILNKSNLIDEVIFNYNTINPSSVVLGSYQVKYVDESNNLIEYPTVKNDLSLGTYTEIAKNFSNYLLSDDSKKSVTLTDNIRQTIVFKYKKRNITITTPGSITIKYVDQDGNDLDDPDMLDNLKLGIYTEYAKDFDGYSLIGNSSQTVTLTESNPDKTIVFHYKKDSISIDPHKEKPKKEKDKKKDNPINDIEITEPIKDEAITTPEPIIIPEEIIGKITVRYVDDNENDIGEPKRLDNLKLGEYTERAKEFNNYRLNDENIKTIVLTKDKKEQIIEFKYKKIIPQVTRLPQTGEKNNNINFMSSLVLILSILIWGLKRKES